MKNSTSVSTEYLRTQQERRVRGSLGLYLDEISAMRVLDPDEVEELAGLLAAQTQAFREAVIEMPGTARLLLERWRAKREGGHSVAALSEDYRDGKGGDPGALVEAAALRAESLLDQGAAPEEVRQAIHEARFSMAVLEDCYACFARIRRAQGREAGGRKARSDAYSLTGLPIREFAARVCKLQKVRDDLYATKDRFIVHNLRLVAKVSRRYLGLGVPLEDLIQEANLGLIRAVEKFDHRLGYRFSTYAIWWIQQSLIRAVQRHGRDVRLPSHVHQRIVELARAEGALELRLRRAPTEAELASELSTPKEQVRRLLEVRRKAVSLEKPVVDSESRTLGDSLPAYALEPGVLIDAFRDHARAQKLLHCLGPRERAVLEARFGLRGDESETLQSIGDRIGVSRERVRQIENRALEKLRALAGHPT